MITLYGIAISNYYNKVKLALMEKGIEFTEEATVFSKEPEFLAKSALGKIPFILTANGYLSESQAILEYLEEAFPETPLYPTDIFERAKCREIIQHLELNIEQIARRLYGEVLFGSPVSEETKQEVKTKLESGFQNIARLFKFSPFVLGEQFTAADVIAWPHLRLVGFVTQQIYGNNFAITYLPGLEQYMATMESRPCVQKVLTDNLAALEAFFNKK
ncbi:MAG: glutathione S-transferase family protein [Methylococcaceae bacterium]|jgi:glutathione S-transferase